MSFSNVSREFHLTPNGWVKGTEEYDMSLTEVQVPNDVVLTRTYEEFQSSPFSKNRKTVHDYSISQDESLVNDLLKKFGNSLEKHNDYI